MRQAGVLMALGMLQSGRSDLINFSIIKSILRCDEAPRNKVIKDLQHIPPGEKLRALSL